MSTYNHYAPTENPRNSRHSSGVVAGVVALCAAAVASIVLVVVLSLTGHGIGAHTTVSPPAAASSGRSSAPATGPTPSASVKTLQEQLGRLNYYEGTVDGLMGPQTEAAIADLQRQAGLPQTGQMNSATEAALSNYLAHGNNQMGGN
jgi:hypothetical protein